MVDSSLTLGCLGSHLRRRPSATVALPVSAGASARPNPRRVRLTRRGRLVASGLFVGLLAAVLAGLLALHSPAGVAAPEGPGGRHEVVVRPGDSLWSIAARHEPSRDPFVTIEEIRRINQLHDYTVHPGQTLRLP